MAVCDSNERSRSGSGFNAGQRLETDRQALSSEADGGAKAQACDEEEGVIGSKRQ